MSNLLEDLLSELNRTIFYREFSFARNVFFKTPGESKEFADHVVWLDDMLFIYQLKERETTANESAENEQRWFERKVVGKATKQIRDTLRYLDSITHISVENQRGHTFTLSRARVNSIIKLILYKASDLLPVECRRVRHHISKTAGFIHVLPWEDYIGICRILLTPAELKDYFTVREEVIKQVGQRGQHVPSERALLGHFLSGLTEPISERFRIYVHTFRHDPSEFELHPFFRDLGDKFENDKDSKGERIYYKILAAFAELNRVELKDVITCTDDCLEMVRKGACSGATRMVSLGNQCGFVFVAVNIESISRQENMLHNLTMLSKHETRLPRHVGISFAKEGPEWLINWYYLNCVWESDFELDALVKQFDFFRPFVVERRTMYHFVH